MKNDQINELWIFGWFLDFIDVKWSNGWKMIRWMENESVDQHLFLGWILGHINETWENGWKNQMNENRANG